MAKILIVEDDEALLHVIKDNLAQEHHVVEVVTDGQAAYYLLKDYEYELVVLDLSIPKLDGIELLKRYRAGGGKARVLILTGRTTIPEKEIGLNAGADDYLTKPFHVRELLARIRALMRRPPELSGDQIRMGDLTIIPRLFQVTINDCEVKLTPREFAILEFLARHPNEVFGSNMLLDRIWPSDSAVGTANVKSYVHRLRDKLGQGDNVPKLVTVHGAGYKLAWKDAQV